MMIYANSDSSGFEATKRTEWLEHFVSCIYIYINIMYFVMYKSSVCVCVCFALLFWQCKLWMNGLVM